MPLGGGALVVLRVIELAIGGPEEAEIVGTTQAGI